MDNDKIYFNALNLTSVITPARFKKLTTVLGSAKNIWQARESELKKSGIENQIIEEFLLKRSEINPEEEFKKLEKEKVELVTISDGEYPPLLKEIHDPPIVLYVKGNLKYNPDLSLAVVGTRNFSNYGKEVTDPLVGDLTNLGFTIISGMAKGIDTLAHQAALSRGGKTIAVLGSGIDNYSIYPSQNRYLAQKIIESNGAVISEFPLATPPSPFNFPQRNRVIAGMSRGVLVVEAPDKSGALITAHHALEQNREVFAVPGSIFSKNSRGTNTLIKMGAKLVSSVEDILEEFGIEPDFAKTEEDKIMPGSKEEGLILDVLKKENEPIHIDKLIEKTGLEPSVISSSLTIMEIEGKVRNLGGGMYTIKR